VRTTLIAGTLALLTMSTMSTMSTASAVAGQQPSLDYDYFRTKVQPIFVAKRPGRARCIACHGSGTPLRLQPLPAGSTSWSDDDSRKNFQAMQRVAFAGNARSRLLLHPLEETAGGDFYHSGGKHFASQNDPEWLVLKAWVLGQK
jgi:hypothetical protein